MSAASGCEACCMRPHCPPAAGELTSSHCSASSSEVLLSDLSPVPAVYSFGFPCAWCEENQISSASFVCTWRNGHLSVNQHPECKVMSSITSTPPVGCSSPGSPCRPEKCPTALGPSALQPDACAFKEFSLGRTCWQLLLTATPAMNP